MYNQDKNESRNVRVCMNYARRIPLALTLSCATLLTACASKPETKISQAAEMSKEKVTVVHNARAEQEAFNELDVRLGLKPAIGQVRTIVGNGYGDSVELSRRDALNNLAGSIQVDVVNQVKICTNQYGDCGSVVQVNTRSELPILGVQYQQLASEQGLLRFQAWVDSQYSLPIYVRELDKLTKAIADNQRALRQNLTADQRYQVTSALVADIPQYDKKRLVANVLGGYTQQARPKVDLKKLRYQLKQLEGRASSLRFAAKILAKGVAVNRIYLHPPIPKNVQEVTPFASALKKHLSPLLQTVSLPGRAKYNMEGEYEVLNNGDIYLSYRLVDLNYKVLSSHSVIVEKSAHQNFRSKPSSVSFETLLHNNVALSNAFRAELKTLHGADTLYYRVGDSLKLLVRLNRGGYYYIVGHVVREGEQFSYLLDLNDGQGDDMFIRHIPQDQANKYIEIAEFEVSPPYGAEHLQLIASNKKFKHLPAYEYTYRPNEGAGYYALIASEGNAAAGVAETRALRIRQNRNDVLTSETTLTYTSRPRNSDNF